VLNLPIFLLLILIFVVSFIFGGIVGGLSGVVAWLSFILALGNRTTDIRVAYMSIILWMMALVLSLWYKLFPDKRIDSLSALLLSYLPLVGVFLISSEHELAQYAGLLYLLLILFLPTQRISQNFLSKSSKKTVLAFAMGVQILAVGLLTLSPYVFSYALLLWWWYKLTAGKYKAARTLQEG